MIRDRGSNFTGAFDAVLAEAGIWAVLCSIRTPRMNAIAERWISGCRMACELLAWKQMLALEGPRPGLGTQKAAAAPVFRRRTPRPRRPPPAAAPRHDLALGHPDHQRRSPACRTWHPADQPEPSPPPGKETHGPVEPHPPGATAGISAMAGS
jgi:hypothetical protein